jgi:nicotinamidase/pyrazinamidase
MKINQAEDVLLVVDVQNDFVSGSMASPGAPGIIEPINKLSALFAHVIIVKDWHTPNHISFASYHEEVSDEGFAQTRYGQQFAGPVHCVRGTWGAELAVGLDLTKAELEFRKGYLQDTDSRGAFHMNDGTPTGFAELLKVRGYTRVFGVGIAKYGCVGTTLKGAAREGFTSVIIEDACQAVYGLRPKTPAEIREIDRVSALELQAAGVSSVFADQLTV